MTPTFKRVSRCLSLIGAIYISAVFAFLAFRETDLRLIWEEIVSNFSFKFLFLGLIFNSMFILVRAIYQYNNLEGTGNIRLGSSLAAVASGQAANVILPFRGGDILRIAILKLQSGIPTASALSYMALEKWLDFCLMGALALSFILAGTSAAVMEGKGIAISVIVAISATGAILVAYISKNNCLLSILAKFTPHNIMEKIVAINKEFMDGMKMLNDKRKLLAALLLFFTSWILMAGVFYSITAPYEKNLAMPAWCFIALMSFSALSAALPSAPSAIGVMHYAFIVACLAMGCKQNKNELAAFATTAHFLLNCFDLICGAAALLILRLLSISPDKSTMTRLKPANDDR